MHAPLCSASPLSVILPVLHGAGGANMPTYDGLYEDGEGGGAQGYAYESYVKGGQVRPGSAAASAAPPAGTGAAAPRAPAGGRPAAAGGAKKPAI